MECSVFHWKDGKVHSIVKGRHRVSKEFQEMGLSVIYVEEQKLSKLANRVSKGELVIENSTLLETKTLNIPQGVERIIFDRGRLVGMGDYVTILSVIQIVHKYYPEAELFFIGERNKLAIFWKHPFLKTLCYDEEKPEGYYINLHSPCPAGKYESSKDNVLISRNEIFANYVGVPWEGERPILYLFPEDYEHPLVREVLASKGTKVGVALRTAETWKDWVGVVELMKRLVERRITVFSFDEKYEVEIEGVKNVVGLPIRNAMAAASAMDLFITPDTAWLHLCDGLNIPFVAIFGSMDARLHAKKYKFHCEEKEFNTFSLYNSWGCFIQGKCPHNSEPCMYDVCEGKGVTQPCLDGISVEEVLEVVEKELWIR